MDERLERVLREKLRNIGRQYERTRNAYADGKTASEGESSELPTDEQGRVKLVCRRHAEKRAVTLDAAQRPACFESDHTDCEGCVEDIRNGRIETWE